jgi:hypothetical protein
MKREYKVGDRVIVLRNSPGSMNPTGTIEIIKSFDRPDLPRWALLSRNYTLLDDLKLACELPNNIKVL